MGLFDTVKVTCEFCGEKIEEQTNYKDMLEYIDLDKDVDLETAAFIDGTTFNCNSCGSFTTVEIPGIPKVVKMTKKLT